MMQDIFSYLESHHNLVSAWTAIAALFVSVVSIIFTIRNMKLQRVHYRKSVLPIAHISVADYENAISVRLRNDGVGPMIIDRLLVTGDGKCLDSVIEFMPDLPDGLYWTHFVGQIAGSALAADKTITLVSFEGDLKDEKFVKAKRRIRQALAKLSVTVEYHNIYDETMPPETRALDWFGREA